MAGWNKVAIVKHVWFLFSSGEKSMWCQWVKSYLIKGKCFWKIKTPSDPSWVWRKILSLRSVIYPLIRHRIGNGQNTFLWYDNWHHLGPHWDRYGDRIIYDSSLNGDSKFSQIIIGGSWKWPFPNSWDLRELTSQTPNNCLPNSLAVDKAIWFLNSDGVFTIKSAWELWRNKHDTVPWYNLVWGHSTSPKVSFVVWMAIYGRLNTSDRLQLFGISSSSTCPFCLDYDESRPHLFFDCNFTYRIWHAMQSKCNVQWQKVPWPEIVTIVNRESKGKSMKSIITRLSFLCTVYYVWIERNNRIFNKEFKPVEVIIKSIVLMVRSRMLSISNIPIATGDNWFLSQWNLPKSIMKPHPCSDGRAAE
ncbi:uncharacterized protein LOC114267988 [Camellia sinensis]|uniref:uncharacterized protein LOC114267988 n=1 Tax=Camellia sinensis TaxID=4442 RepID=UPI001036E63E|nr:uncharacterized protein LOC114267988 [Camellia sinensis]